MMAAGRLRHPQGRVRRRRRSSPTPRRPSPTAAPAAPRPPPPSSGPSTCSPPRSAWTRPRCAAATSSPPTRSRTRPPSAPPTTSATTSGALDLALEAAGYDELRAEQAAPPRAPATPSQLGIGVAVYVEITAGPTPAASTARSRSRPTAAAIVLHRHVAPRPGPRHRRGRCSSASSSASRWTDIEVVHGDTDLVPDRRRHRWARGRCSSAASAVYEAPPSVVEQAKAAGGRPARGRVDDIVLDTATAGFHVAGTPAVGQGVGRGRRGQPTASEPLVADADVPGRQRRPSRSAPTSPSSRSTPRPARSPSQRLVAVDDAGTHPQPAARRGPAPRRHRPGRRPGAARGDPSTTTTATRSPPTSPTTPSSRPPSCPASSSSRWRRRRRSTRSGAKGIGESGTIGSTPAVQNAVVDALVHLGVRHVDMPATPERVWKRSDREGGRPR